MTKSSVRHAGGNYDHAGLTDSSMHHSGGNDDHADLDDHAGLIDIIDSTVAAAPKSALRAGNARRLENRRATIEADASWIKPPTAGRPDGLNRKEKPPARPPDLPRVKTNGPAAIETTLGIFGVRKELPAMFWVVGVVGKREK